MQDFSFATYPDGWDDFTFICRAELAVPIAAGFMMKLLQMQDGEEKKITACGGIALFTAISPFRVAYSIKPRSPAAGQECVYEEKTEEKRDGSMFLGFP